jgi:hypothetical protein
MTSLLSLGNAATPWLEGSERYQRALQSHPVGASNRSRWSDDILSVAARWLATQFPTQ